MTAGVAATYEPLPTRSLAAGVRWTFLFAAFLAYLFAITTYQLPIANVAMIAALVGVVVQREALRIPAMLFWYVLFMIWSAVGYLVTQYPAVVWDELVTFAN